MTSRQPGRSSRRVRESPVPRRGGGPPVEGGEPRRPASGSPHPTSGRSWRPWRRCCSVSSRGACSVASSARSRPTACLARPGERHAIVAGVSGTVVDVLVRTRDTVEPGQAVARVRLPEVDRQARIARARVDVLEAQLADTPGPDARLRAARAELREVDAIAQAGGLVVSPHAGEVTAIDLVPGQAVTAGTQVAEIRTGGNHRLPGGRTRRPRQCTTPRRRHGGTGSDPGCGRPRRGAGVGGPVSARSLHGRSRRRAGWLVRGSRRTPVVT